MNGIDKESLKNMSLEDMARGIIDMVYSMHESNEKFFESQPPKCSKKFVQVRHVKIAGIAIVSFLLGYSALTWPQVLRFIPFL